MAPRPKKLLERLHPRLATWFHDTFGDFTQAQLHCVKQLKIGDLFIFGGQILRLIDTGVQEAQIWLKWRRSGPCDPLLLVR